MKGLDTPVLLDLLHGRRTARRLLETAQAEELCTTELNLFELEVIARSDRRPGRERRLAALERLRRKLTVLPIDERAVHAAAVLATSQARAASSTALLALGAAESAGVSEWLSSEAAATPKAPRRLRVRQYGQRGAK